MVTDICKNAAIVNKKENTPDQANLGENSFEMKSKFEEEDVTSEVGLISPDKIKTGRNMTREMTWDNQTSCNIPPPLASFETYFLITTLSIAVVILDPTPRTNPLTDEVMADRSAIIPTTNPKMMIAQPNNVVWGILWNGLPRKAADKRSVKGSKSPRAI